ncbi:RICIN domain-containing protein [Streptomyces nitrosporeus]|uniref:RICIN domain-containing protein n=1 Tax=Streptomyces nitrosporeus TaxID=28894 RepID=UPI00331E891C
MRRFRPAAALLSGLLLAFPVPVLAPTAAALAAPAPASSAPASTTAGPGADGPDLGHANRATPAAGLPDWSRAGYRGGLSLPGDEAVTGDASCRITPDELASTYQVVADDGADDTTGLQRAIDDIRNRCSPQAGYDRLSLISLPAGRVDVSRQMYVDADFLIVRGQGSGDGGTRLVFRPDTDTRYDTVVNGRWDQNSMKAGSGSDAGTGGWIWPGRGLFRVQTREVATRYQDDWEAAPANRKDLFEGSVNQHWASGIKVAAAPEDPGYAARQGQNVVHLDAKADMGKFTQGGYVWVGAANSVAFYEQQGVTDRGAMENLHMRQQMFRVTGTDDTARTVTLDRALEWDVPVDSESDGSAPLSDKPYPSKVTPLKAVEGVGFENFAFTQDMSGLPKPGGGTYQLTADQAEHNYGNLAPEYAMHGIVFKWAANSWARGLDARMTGSHPIVTESARNLQIERNSFDGAWNKGKGGNGYLRGSRVWDSLYAFNLSRNLRHFTFQWSAAGNVAFRNDLDSDLNLHGGWENHNLFEQNTLRVPYEHRSGNCEANCGGEGGESDEGTWYPIWWAAGPKAVKWSGSSGPQNVFYDNTLTKQAVPGGPFTPYAPYGTQSGTAYQFGSDDTDPNRFRPLSQDGQAIGDWTGRETQDFTGQGVAARDMGGRPSLFLRDTGDGLDPRDTNSRKVVTWNMQGGGTGDGSYTSKYSQGIQPLLQQNGASVILLQEAGSPPGSAAFLQEIPQRPPVFFDWAGGDVPVREYRYGGTAARPLGYLYWLHTDSSTSSVNRVNLAVMSRTRVRPEDVYVIAAGRDSGFTGRPALGIAVDGVVYFTVHGLSGTGNDDIGLLENIRTRMATAGPGGTALPWAALGDYNRPPHVPSPASTRPERPLAPALEQALPGVYTVRAPRQPTHPTIPIQDSTPRILDYAVTEADDTAPTVEGVSRVSGMTLSDHFPVLYELGNLPDPPEPPADAVPATPQAAVLRNAATTGVAGPSRGDAHVVADGPVDRADLPSQTFSLSPDPESPGYYRLFHRVSGRYLGQEGGARDARTVLWWGHPEDQLWRPAYQGDGTWTLENRHTGQMLTTVGDGAALAGRDADGSASQRWFLQEPADATSVNEIALDEPAPTPLLIDVAGGSTAENTPVNLRQDTDASSGRFTAVHAGRTGDDLCYYLIQGGKYVNSTAARPREPRSGDAVTLNSFRSNDDGYLWCTTTGGRFLSNHSTAAPDQRLYLTDHGPGRQLTVNARVPGIPTDSWNWEGIGV